MTATMLDVVDRRARDIPDRIAFVVEDEIVTYRGLADDSVALAARIAAAGVAPGDCCAIVLPTCADAIRLVYAVQRAGGVPAIVDPGLPAPVMKRRIERLVPAAVFGSGDLASALGAASALSFQVRTIADLPLASARPAHRPSPEDLAYLQFTSGSTGEARAAAVSHRSLLAGLASIGARFDITESDVAATWAPLHYSPGLVRYVFGGPYFGCTTHVIRPSATEIDRWIHLLARTRATITSSPDFAFRLAARTMGRTGITLDALRIATNGGEAVRAGTIELFERTFGVPQVVQPAYGLSEATLIVASPAPGSPLDVDDTGAVSCGAPLPGVEVRIVDADGRVCVPGIEGVIQVRGDMVFNGYIADDAGTRDVLRDGWLHTGDIGILSAAGNLHPRARARALIKRAGAGLPPREIEERVDEIDGVLRAAAVGVSRSGRMTEELIVVVETRTDSAGRQRIIEDVEHSVRTTIGVVPAGVVLVNPGTIPRTASGKIQYLELQRLLADPKALRRMDVTV